MSEEYAGLLEQKRKAYAAYKQARTEMKELHNVKVNVDYLLGKDVAERERNNMRQ